MSDAYDAYAVLSHVTLHVGMPCQTPGGLTPHVNADDPAISVMTDFRKVTPVTIEPGLGIDTAIRKMKESGVRLLLVPDLDDRIIGIITATDIQGERSFRLGQELGIARTDIRVEMLMVPLDRVMAMDIVTVHDARVGHIIASLRKLERHHTLVVETDTYSGIQTIRGLFSVSHISKMMGHEVAHAEYPAHSLAEVQHELG
jgi:CBS-domain-containing membrane protein